MFHAEAPEFPVQHAATLCATPRTAPMKDCTPLLMVPQTPRCPAVALSGQLPVLPCSQVSNMSEELAAGPVKLISTDPPRGCSSTFPGWLSGQPPSAAALCGGGQLFDGAQKCSCRYASQASLVMGVCCAPFRLRSIIWISGLCLRNLSRKTAFWCFTYARRARLVFFYTLFLDVCRRAQLDQYAQLLQRASLMLALSIKPHWSPYPPTNRLTENTGLKLAHAHAVFTRRLHNPGA